MKRRTAKHEELVREVKQWERKALDPTTWTDAPEAVPNVSKSTTISIRLPTMMLAILREFSRRERVGYQVLIKRWLDDRIRAEADKLVHTKLLGPIVHLQAASFGPAPRERVEVSPTAVSDAQ